MLSVLLVFCLAACGRGNAGPEESFVVPTAAAGNVASSGNRRLTIAVAQESPAPELMAAITAFKAEYPHYSVDIINYYEAAANNMDAGLTLLIADIEGGRAPDMLYMPPFLTNELSRSGYLDNLYSYIDGDVELKRGSFPSGLLDACEINGSLYTFASTFCIVTAEGPEDILGNGSALTFEKMRAAMGEVRSGVMMLPPGLSRESFMQYCFMASGNSILNRNYMTGNFNSPEYIEMLEFCRDMPDTSGKSGEPLISFRVITSFSVAMASRVYMGLPVLNDRDSGSIAVFTTAELGIFSGSENKDASWSLLRRLLLEQFQLQRARERFKTGAPYLPTNVDALERMAEDTLSVGGAFYAEDQPGTAEGAERILMLAKGVSNVYREKREDFLKEASPIEQIVLREASLFFEGAKTASEAASATETAVRTYLSSGVFEEDGGQ